MIVVNRNQTAIFGNIDGSKFPNIPLDAALYEKLRLIAKEANSKTNKKEYEKVRTQFKLALNSSTPKIENSTSNLTSNVKEVIKPTKVGNQNYQIEKLNDGHSYLFNGKTYSRFYIPNELLERIQTSESKGIDATPLYKFFIRALRGEVMTQAKLNRVCIYIGKPWIDTEEQQRLTEKGYSIEEAIKQASGRQVGITLEGLLSTYKASVLVREIGDIIDESIIEPEDENVDDKNEEGEKKTFDELLKEIKANHKLVDFVFVPIRNSKGHFLKRGSDDYIAEYNRQLEDFKIKNKLSGPITTTINQSSSNWGKPQGSKALARTKSAEDFIYQPANQGQSGDAFYCGDKLGHDIQVGKVHYLPRWDQVNTNDFTTVVPGLHVGGMDYVKAYANSRNSIVHNIFVDPAHIGACVQVETTDGAMRVKQYFVHSSLSDKPNRGIYNSSTYARQLDEEWDANFDKASQTLKEVEAKIEALRKEAKEAQVVVDSRF